MRPGAWPTLPSDARLAGTSYRHRRLVLLALAARTLGIAILGEVSRGTIVDTFSVPGTQSQRALTQLPQALPTLVAPGVDQIDSALDRQSDVLTTSTLSA